MAINTALNTPLSRLILYLQKKIREGRRKELLVVPVDIVKALVQSPVKADFTSIRALVNLFDGYNKGNCSRLDVASFHCVLHVLLTTRQSPNRERGLYLFLESLREVTDVTSGTNGQPIRGTLQKRKTILAQKLHRQLFEIFSSDNTALPRRWCGEFILEFIRGSGHNRLLLTTSLNEHLRNFGRILLTETDYSLSIVAGATIREMLVAQFDASLFWPTDLIHTAGRFPSTGVADSNWIRELFEYLLCPDPNGTEQTPKRTIMIQSLEIEGLEIASPSVSLVGLVLDDPIKFLVVKNGRLNFVEMPVKAISDLEFLETRIIFRLRHDGHYIAHGQSRWVDQVLIDASDVTTAAGAATLVKAMMVSPGEAREKRVHFAPSHDSPAHPESNGRGQRRHGSSAFLELPKSHQAAEHDVTLPVTKPAAQNPSVQASRARQHSVATLDLPTRDEVVKASEIYLKRQPKYTQIDIQEPEPTEEVTHVRRTESPVATAEVLAGEAGSPETVPESGRQSNNVSIVQDSLEDEELRVESSRDGYHGVGRDLPLQAQGALRLLHSTQPPLTTVEEPAQPPVISDQKSSSIVPPPVAEAREAGDKVEATMALGNRTAAQSVRERKKQLKTEAAEAKEKEPEADRVSVPDQKSRLKRPHHRLRRVTSHKRSVDWDQDLRVDKGISPPEPKKTKPPLADPTPINIDRKPLPSAEKSEKSVAHSTRTPAPPNKVKQPSSSNEKANQGVTQTIASTRRARKAAVKAKERLAIANEYENIAYDPDDPIECSSQVMPDASKPREIDSALQGTLSVQRAEGAKGVMQTDPQPLDLIPADEYDIHHSVHESAEIALVGPSTELFEPLTGKPAPLTHSAESKPNHVPCPNNNLPMVDGRPAINKKAEDFDKLTGNTARSDHKMNVERPVVAPRPVDNNLPSGPRNVSALSQKVSQFISRQQVANTHQDIPKTQTGRKVDMSLDADRQETSVLEQDVQQHHSPTRGNNVHGAMESSERERGEGINGKDDGLAAEEKHETSSKLPPLEQADSLAAEDTRFHENNGVEQETAGGLDPVSSPISHTGIDDDMALSEASTLIQRAAMDSSPLRPSGSSSLCELTREEFLTGCPREGSSDSSTSSLVYRKSPCPQRLVAPGPRTAGLGSSSKELEKEEAPMAASPVPTRVSCFDRPVTERELVEEVGLRNVTKEAPVSRGPEDGTKLRYMAPAPSTFVERLKAVRNLPGNGECGNLPERPEARLSGPFESPGSDSWEQPRDPSSQTGTQTTTYTSFDSSEHASQHASISDEESREDPASAWGKALRESQQTSLDILLDTSHRLIHDMVNEEKAIASVVETYRNGCNRIIRQMAKAQDENLKYVEMAQAEVRSKVISKCREALGGLNEAGTNHHALNRMAGPRTLGVEMKKQTSELNRQVNNMLEGL